MILRFVLLGCVLPAARHGHRSLAHFVLDGGNAELIDDRRPLIVKLDQVVGGRARQARRVTAHGSRQSNKYGPSEIELST